MKPIIVGIDPGTTSAFAALSLDFNVLKVRSERNYSFNKLVTDIYLAGNPVIVGTDKKEVPSFIREFSQKTGAKIYAPRYDTKKDEKLHIVKGKGFGELVGNTHEADALASAIYAYNFYKPLISKVDRFVTENDKFSIRDKLFVKVLIEEKSIAQAAEELERKPLKKEIAGPVPSGQGIQVKTSEQKELALMRAALKNLEDELKASQKENAMLRDKRIDISGEIKKLIAFKERRALVLEKENRALKKDISRLEKIIRKLNRFIGRSGNMVLLKKLDNLSIAEFNRKEKFLSIDAEDILLIEDITVFSEEVIGKLIGRVKLIIHPGGKNKILAEKFYLVPKEELHLVETKFYALADKDEIDSKIAELSKRKKAKEFLNDLISEYRRERA